MRKFRIEEAVFDLFPDLKIAVLIFSNINNKHNFTEVEYENIYHEIYEMISKIGDSHPYIEDYRKAMTQIIRKKGSAASIDAMVKRLKTGGKLRPVNPVVDLYNFISLKHLFTCGGEDLDKLVGNMVLRFAKGDESFVALGEAENKSPRKGELIYSDDQGAVVRSWLWREADRTKITNESQNVLLYLELVNESRDEEFVNAIMELKNMVCEKLGGTVMSEILSKDIKECNIA